ncbi:MAG: DUF1080 domain-containing protein [Rhodopirellula sp. JB044]|uniref:3-keto-disaccharide hydrolase n=1 Tax=Rhodopirellula sp. JB044 TaxID=3342844 RepID=UPI00370CA4F5
MTRLTGRFAVFTAFLLTIGSPALAQDRSESGKPGPGNDRSLLSDVSDKEFSLRSRPLFDGTVLAGWEGNAYWFHTEGTAVVAGRLSERIPENQFLCTTETFGDFDLRMEVRMRGTDPNAGVQFRSRRPRSSDKIPANEVIGYQADMGNAWGRSVWGALYDESRRRKMLVEPDTPFEVQWSQTQPDSSTEEASGEPRDGCEPGESGVPESQWVPMRIVCKKDQIEIFLDGHRTIQYTETDPEIPRFGVIGLQIHSGPPAEAWYRNIRILSL